MESFRLPDLPFPIDSLEPYMSQATLEKHHGKHHQAYINKLNALLQEPQHATHQGKKLAEIVKASSGNLFNQAAQVWNHTFFWHSLTGQKQQQMQGYESSDVYTQIIKDFGDFTTFKSQFKQTALSTFGSGWVWLVKKSDGHLIIQSTKDANTPITTEDMLPILTCDVWEHAYYLDTQNDRGQYVENFWKIVNWSKVNERYLTETLID
ncbi:superoxide dismutase [Gammaproteobacteria bacterium]|nr:superoxide dismutase [Gammaproteobacteria bacterium]